MANVANKANKGVGSPEIKEKLERKARQIFRGVTTPVYL
jgi:hypothetical protein